jgi:hypothetical protein
LTTPLVAHTDADTTATGAMELCMRSRPFELGFIHTCSAMKKPAEAGLMCVKERRDQSRA